MKLEEMLRLLDAAENHPVLSCRDKNTLTRRDHFAVAALTGFVTQGSHDYQSMAQNSYRLADAMEAERNKEGAE